MTPIQQRLLEMLEEIVAICEERGIVYYAAGGTALGALRHRGFIPWDDDIDLMMPREDWERFVEAAKEGLPPNRALCCLELDENYPHVFGRYVDLTSTMIHYNQFLGGTPEGFVIDIFVLDPVVDAGEAFSQHREALALYNDLANPLGYSYPMSSNPVVINEYEKRIESEGRRPVLSELEEQLCRYSPEESAFLVMRWAAAPRLLPIEWFSYPRYEEFEGIRLRVPSKCADYLTYHYGDDWMYIPDDTGRLVHDAIMFCDVSYDKVLDDYLPFIDVQKTKKAILSRRQAHIRDMEMLRRAEDVKAHIIASFIQKVTIERSKGQESVLVELLEKGHHDKLDEIFGLFYRWQCDAALEGREEYLHIRRYHDPVYADIGDWLLSVALLNLIDSNRVAKAARILRVRERVLGALSFGLEVVKGILEAVRMPSSLLDVGLEQESFEFAWDFVNRRPGNFSVRLFLLERLYERGRFDELGRVAEAGLVFFPESGEYKKFLADSKLNAASTIGEREQAVFWYLEALHATTQSEIISDARETLSALANDSEVNSAYSESAKKACATAKQAVPASAPLYDCGKVAEKLNNLLAELDEICEKNGITRFLGPVSCALALEFGCNEPGIPQIDMLVPENEIPRLADVIQAESRDDRVLDCWLTNPRYLTFGLDYVDKTSTFLQLEEGTNVKAHGLKVKVIPLRSVGSGKGTIDALESAFGSALETGWEINGYQLTKRITAKRAASAAVARACMVVGRKTLAKGLFGLLSQSGTDQPERYGIRVAYKDTRKFDSRYFECSEMLEFGERNYPAPSRPNDFVEEWFGSNWKASLGAITALPKDVLIDPETGYEGVESYLEDEGWPLDMLFGLMRSIRWGMLGEANNLRIRNRAMSIAEMSRDRKLLYDSLQKRDDLLNNLVSQGDIEGLSSELEDYKNAALRYLKKGLGLCPCKGYLDMLSLTLRAEGNEKIAEKLLELAPEQHYLPIGE